MSKNDKFILYLGALVFVAGLTYFNFTGNTFFVVTSVPAAFLAGWAMGFLFEVDAHLETLDRHLDFTAEIAKSMLELPNLNPQSRAILEKVVERNAERSVKRKERQL